MNKNIFLVLSFSMLLSYAAENKKTCSIFSHPNNKKQEDRAVYNEIQRDFFLGVYDGHGGHRVAEILSTDLHQYFKESLKSSECTVKNAMLNAFQQIENNVLSRKCDGGSTAIAAYITSDKLCLANVGDCRAILECDGCVGLATQDHTIERADELERVLAAKATIFRHVSIQNDTQKVVKEYDWRVNGVNMTRVIGNRDLKGSLRCAFSVSGRWLPNDCTAVLELYPNNQRVDELEITPKKGQLIADPEYTEITLTEKNRWLILATDGFTDFVSNEEAVQLVVHYSQNGQSLDQITQQLVQHAIQKGSQDNVTVMIFDLWKRHY